MDAMSVGAAVRRETHDPGTTGRAACNRGGLSEPRPGKMGDRHDGWLPLRKYRVPAYPEGEKGTLRFEKWTTAVQCKTPFISETQRGGKERKKSRQGDGLGALSQRGDILGQPFQDLGGQHN